MDNQELVNKIKTYEDRIFYVENEFLIHRYPL